MKTAFTTVFAHYSIWSLPRHGYARTRLHEFSYSQCKSGPNMNVGMTNGHCSVTWAKNSSVGRGTPHDTPMKIPTDSHLVWQFLWCVPWHWQIVTASTSHSTPDSGCVPQCRQSAHAVHYWYYATHERAQVRCITGHFKRRLLMPVRRETLNVLHWMNYMYVLSALFLPEHYVGLFASDITYAWTLCYSFCFGCVFALCFC